MVEVVDYAVVDGNTFILGSCNKGGVLNGGLGSSSGAVLLCKASKTCIKALHVLLPAVKLGVIDDGGLVSSERIFMDYWWRKSVEFTAVSLKCLGVKVTLLVSPVILVVKKTWHISSDSHKYQNTILQYLVPPMNIIDQFCD